MAVAAGSGEYAQAKTQADLIYHQETVIRSLGSTVNQAGGLLANSPTTLASTQTTQPTHMLTRQQSMARSATPQINDTPGNQQQKITVATKHQKHHLPRTKAPHGEYADAFSRGLKLITTLNATSTLRLEPGQSISRDRAVERRPRRRRRRHHRRSHPSTTQEQHQVRAEFHVDQYLSAFDPSSAVDSIENSITANMSGNISKMIDDISAGPNQAFAAAAHLR